MSRPRGARGLSAKVSSTEIREEEEEEESVEASGDSLKAAGSKEHLGRTGGSNNKRRAHQENVMQIVESN